MLKKQSLNDGEDPTRKIENESFVVALHSYAAQEAGELTFREGQIIKVTEHHESGWWIGEFQDMNDEKHVGQFPNNYTKPYQAKANISN